MNQKDILYFDFKHLIELNRESSKEFLNMLINVLYKQKYDESIINHFENINLEQSWWNKLHYYLYYNNKLYDLIEFIIIRAKHHKILFR